MIVPFCDFCVSNVVFGEDDQPWDTNPIGCFSLDAVYALLLSCCSMIMLSCAGITDMQRGGVYSQSEVVKVVLVTTSEILYFGLR